mgnify:CR=1 FL=1
MFICNSGTDEFAELMKYAPLDIAMSASVFFYHLGMDLSIAMLNSLDKKNEEILAQYLTSQPNGGGTTQSMGYLTEILQNLNISLN